MQDPDDTEVIQQARGHLEAFLGIVVVPIPALMVLGQAIVSGGSEAAGRQLEAFGLRLAIPTASVLVSTAAVVALFAAARSLAALGSLLENSSTRNAAERAIRRHAASLNPFFLMPRRALALIDVLPRFLLGTLIAALVITDLTADLIIHHFGWFFVWKSAALPDYLSGEEYSVLLLFFMLALKYVAMGYFLYALVIIDENIGVGSREQKAMIAGLAAVAVLFVLARLLRNDGGGSPVFPNS